MAGSLLLLISLFFLGLSPLLAKTSQNTSPTKIPKQFNPLKAKKSLMAQSKADIKLIVDKFYDSEGAMIQQIQWVTNNQYNVDLYSKKRRCFRHKVLVDRKRKVVDFKGGMKSCD